MYVYVRSNIEDNTVLKTLNLSIMYEYILLFICSGCCWGRHLTFDEPANISFRKPGMGVIFEDKKKTT